MPKLKEYAAKNEFVQRRGPSDSGSGTVVGGALGNHGRVFDFCRNRDVYKRQGIMKTRKACGAMLPIFSNWDKTV